MSNLAGEVRNTKGLRPVRLNRELMLLTDPQLSWILDRLDIVGSISPEFDLEDAFKSTTAKSSLRRLFLSLYRSRNSSLPRAEPCSWNLFLRRR